MNVENFYLRGMLFAPEGKQQISYYLCFMEFPEDADISSSDFTQVNTNPAYIPNPPAPPHICLYQCNKDLSAFSLIGYTGPTKTIALPTYSYSPYTPKTYIHVIDSTGTEYRGDPNSGRPPKIVLNANPDSDYTTTNTIVQSTLGTNECFVVVIASSKGESVDVSNWFSSMEVQESNLVCALETSGGASTYQAPIGVYGPATNIIQTTQVSGGNTPSPIDWGSVYPL